MVLLKYLLQAEKKTLINIRKIKWCTDKQDNNYNNARLPLMESVIALQTKFKYFVLAVR